MSPKRLAAALFGCLAAPCAAAGYDVSISGISLTDSATDTADIVAIHNGREFDVTADLKWGDQIHDDTSTNVLAWAMYVDGAEEGRGTIDLTESRALPSQLEAGKAAVRGSGGHVIKVKITLDDLADEEERSYQSFAPGASFVPLLIVIFFAVATRMVELSLGIGVFVGACMVAGTLVGGFRSTLDVYILDAVADKYHAYVYLFTFFLSGLIGMIERSGGLRGLTDALGRYARSSRSAQGASFLAGVIVFFDDYANTLVAGSSMRTLTDACMVSREKLAFIVDATAAPIASIVPISSWVGFEISLIQTEIDKILVSNPNPAIDTTGFAVFSDNTSVHSPALYHRHLFSYLS